MAATFKVIAGIAYMGVILAVAAFAMTKVPTRQRRIKLL